MFDFDPDGIADEMDCEIDDSDEEIEDEDNETDTEEEGIGADEAIIAGALIGFGLEEGQEENKTKKKIANDSDFSIEKERERATPLKKRPRINLNPNRREPGFEQWVMDIATGKKKIGEE